MCNEYTAWHIRLWRTSRWLLSKSSVLAWPVQVQERPGQNGTFVFEINGRFCTTWIFALYVLLVKLINCHAIYVHTYFCATILLNPDRRGGSGWQRGVHRDPVPAADALLHQPDPVHPLLLRHRRHRHQHDDVQVGPRSIKQSDTLVILIYSLGNPKNVIVT